VLGEGSDEKILGFACKYKSQTQKIAIIDALCFDFHVKLTIAGKDQLLMNM
jgi:hypothetical protein